MLKFFSVVLLCLFTLGKSCNSTRNVSIQRFDKESFEQLLTTKDIIIDFKRTPCFGTCPSYRIIAFNDYTLAFHGQMFVDSVGYFISSISLKNIKQIQYKAEEIDFFSLQKQYPLEVNIADLPSTITKLSYKEKEHEVTNKNYNSPEFLTNFEILLDSLLIPSRYIKQNNTIHTK